MRGIKLLLALLLTPVAWGAALVQGNFAVYASSSSDAVAAFSSNVTSGNLIVVAVGHVGPLSAQVSGVTDSLGTTYTHATSRTDSSSWWITTIWWGVAPSSGPNTVTATLGGASSTRRIIITEFSGITSPVLDVASPVSDLAASTYNSTPVTPSITTTANGELVFAAVMNLTYARTVSAGSGFTQASYTGAMVMGVHTEYQTQASAGAISAGWTLSGGDYWLTSIASFKSGAAPAGAARRRIINQ